MFAEIHRELNLQHKNKKHKKHKKSYLRSKAMAFNGQAIEKRTAKFSQLMSSKDPLENA